MYGNEAEVGRALQELQIPREEAGFLRCFDTEPLVEGSLLGQNHGLVARFRFRRGVYRYQAHRPRARAGGSRPRLEGVTGCWAQHGVLGLAAVTRFVV